MSLLSQKNSGHQEVQLAFKSVSLKVKDRHIMDQVEQETENDH
jgi:hypothetical protein